MVGGESMIKELLKEYGIYSCDVVNVSENFYKVITENRYYAFKRTKKTNFNVENWQYLFQQKDKMNFNGILPVYRTNSNNLYVEVDGFIFYLSPWIVETDRAFEIKNAFKLIGQFHKQTQRIYTVNSEKVVARFKEYKLNVNRYQQELLFIVEKSEQKHYMSPLELLVCTYYRNIEAAISMLNTTIDKYIDAITEKPTGNISLCHGQLFKDNFIQSERLFIINWERVGYGHSYQDVLMLFTDLMSNNKLNHKLLIDAFKIYLQENNYDLDELYLLNIYLLDCLDYLKEIHSYDGENITSPSMIKQIISLQKIHHRLMFGLSISEFIIDKELDLEDID